MSKQENGQKLESRRNFLKKVAMISAGVTASAALAACSPSTSGAASVEWDKEVDVLVCGSGTVAHAAIAAKDAGAESVLIIEKGVAFGGTSAISGGGFWLPNNYCMKDLGLEDNREDVIKYMKHVTDGQSTDELIETYADKAPVFAEWARDVIGYNWAANQTTYPDYYEVEGFRPFGRTINPTSDGVKSAGGGGVWQMLRSKCNELGIEVLLETAAKKLITDETGAVIGVVAEGIDGVMNIHAKKGVILGTGGFDHNKDMTAAYLRGPIYASNAVTTNTGDGQIMGMAIGADLRNMNESWGLPFFVTDFDALKGDADWQVYRGKPNAIVVNKHGERFGNEATAYEVFQRAFYAWDTGQFEWRNIPAFWICDQTYADYYFMPGSGYQMGQMGDFVQKADTIEELAEKLGINVDGLKATLERFNANAKEGVDPDWHRGEFNFDLTTAGDYTGRTDLANPCLAPVETGPFYGATYHPGTCGTSGGLRINANAQVINVWGEAIPGLYAVGNTCGSPMGAAYPGGGSTLGAGSVFAMLAGQHAAKREA